ncbi:MAG: UDP-3-O-(3-hydroxymyristoyl)glucosamine N-acyltransferase [Kangiellaceae bacterium]|nr:UDP-3-O-(3-hydroxymyristoyl)glucosamine N-acyltransferase [Kangiellaceae bacterium]
MKNAGLTIAEIAKIVNGEVLGDSKHIVTQFSSLETATDNCVTFLSSSKLVDQLNTTLAGCVLLSEQHELPKNLNYVLCPNPYLAYALVSQVFDQSPLPANTLSDSTDIHSSVELAENVCIGAHSVIARTCKIGSGVVIGPNCFIGEGSVLGMNTLVHANVSIYHQVTIGSSCILHSGVVIGSDGFGYANDKGQWIKIPQTGTVILGDNVEIGANTCIDRGALNNTLIGNGVKIDNMCHIAHNVSIGDNTAMAGFSAIAGSAKVGESCQLGGRSSIIGHLDIVAGTHLTAGTLVSKSIETPGIFSSGMIAEDNKSWKRNVARFRQLDKMADRIKQLEKRLSLRESE